MVAVAVAWRDGLKDKSPALHRFLTRRDRPWPAVREVLGFALVIVLGACLLWGGTGQPFPHRPIVVVESASMMHCVGQAHQGLEGNACSATRFGRFGTIDPGDLVFVAKVDVPSGITTCLAGGTVTGTGQGRMATCGPGGKYGHGGDVIVYRPDGDTQKTPIIHRAIFYLQFTKQADGSYRMTIPELGDAGRDLTNLRGLPFIDQGDGHPIANLGLANPNWAEALLQNLNAHPGIDGASYSGYVTMGDNNPFADQGTIVGLPVQSGWVLGRARGELPWIGMVNLGFQQLVGKSPSPWFSRAPSDIKTMFWVFVLVGVGTPFVVGSMQRARHRKAQAEAEPAGPKAPAGGEQGDPPSGPGPN